MAIENYLYKFELNGIDITDYVLLGSKISKKRSNSYGNTATLYVAKEVDNIITITAGQSITITRGVLSNTEDTEFIGDLKKVEERDNDSYALNFKDPINRLKFDPFTKSYDRNIDSQAGEISAIFTDIAEDGGFTVNAISSGTGVSDITLDKFISANNYRLERMNTLNTILNWFFYFDYENQEIVLRPRGYIEYSTTLEVGNNIVNVPVWEDDIESMRNKVTVLGATEYDTREENEVGDGVTKEFSFTYAPETTELTVNGTLQKRGILNSTETYDYIVDKQLKTYTFVNAPAGSATIVMKYTTYIPTPVTSTNPTSVEQYGLTQHEVYEFKDVKTVEDAEVRALQLLELLSFAETSTTLNISQYDVQVGDRIDVVDSLHPEYSGSYIVDEKIMEYGLPYDVIKIGTPKADLGSVFQTIEERLRLLEESDRELTDLLRHLFNLSSSLIFKNRYIIKQKRDISTDYLWGNTTWNGGFWQDGYNEEPVNYQIQQGRLTYEEYFYDEDFKDSVNNTCTWNTTTKELTFTSGQRYQTTSIFLDSTNQSTVKKATLNYTGTGTFFPCMSVDGGSTWEDVVNGVEFTFTTPGSDLRIKISTEGSQLITSDGDTFLTSDGKNFKVSTGGGSGTITYVSCTHSL